MVNISIGTLLLLSNLLINVYTLEQYVSINNHIGFKGQLIIYFYNAAILFIGGYLLYFRNKIKPTNYLYPVCIGLFFFIIVSEIYLRMNRSTFVRQTLASRILYEANFKDADILLGESNKVKVKFYEYFLFSPDKYSSRTINFTDYYGARHVPHNDAIKGKHLTVWIFGGSTLQEETTSDEYTIGNSIAISLEEKGINAIVRSFGMGGYQSSMEFVKFTELLRREKKPDIAVFYDGFNDAGNAVSYGPGNMQADTTMKQRILIERNHFAVFLYSFNSIMKNCSRLYERTFYNVLNKILFKTIHFRFIDIYNTQEYFDKTLDIYETNYVMGKAVCDKLNIKCYYLLQPMIFTKSPLTTFELEAMNEFKPGGMKSILGMQYINFMDRFYKAVKSRMKNKEQWYDLSGILNGRLENDFIDEGHTGPYTGTFIGENIADIISASYGKEK